MENCWFYRFKQMVTNHCVVECSGDSDEPDFDQNDQSNSDRHDQDHLAFDDAVNGDDDAESCSCDAYDDCSNEGESCDRSINGEKEGKDEEDEEEKIPRRWEDSENLKSCVSADSSDSENEKNRQFWETCLAS